jgi:hypothetical protein
MAKIFLSYRRDDSRHIADRIFDRLKQNYRRDEVFKDVSSIPVGENFVAFIKSRIISAEVVLVIIGNDWVDTFAKRQGQVDFVKEEIASALQLDKNIIPVFVEGVKAVPLQALPVEIQAVAQLQGIEVRPDPDFDQDIAKLIHAINANLTTKTIYTPESPKRDLFSPRNIYIGGFGLIILAATIFFLTREHCEVPKSGVLIANFMEHDRDGFSNSLVTFLDNGLADSLYDVRPVGHQKRDVRNYSDVITRKYFSSWCQPRGIFVNGFLDQEQRVFNLYANLVDMKINRPEFITDNTIFLHNPGNLEFSIREDAQFIASFLLSIIDVHTGNEKRALETLSLLEVNHDKNLKDEEFLAAVALYKGNCYALRGDESRAKREYEKARKSNKPELSEAADRNQRAAQQISTAYQKDPNQTKVRTHNISEHGRIESDLLKIIEREMEKLGRGLEKIFK